MNYQSGHEVISVWDHFTVSSLVRGHDSPMEFNCSLPWCFKGVESPETLAIGKGGKQLRYALPALAHRLMLNQFDMPVHSEPSLVCPILLTSAKLFVLRSGLSMKDYYSAKNISDVAKPCPALLWSQAPDEGLEDFALQKAGSLLAFNGTVGQRLEELEALRSSGRTKTPRWHIEFLFRNLTRSVLVVNLDSFEKILGKIIRAVSQVQDSIKVHARFKRHARGAIERAQPKTGQSFGCQSGR